MTETKKVLLSLAVAGLVASACASGPNVGKSSATPDPDSFIESPSSLIALAAIVDKDGKSVGQAEFRETRLGVRIEVTAQGLPPGKHGIHIHSAAKCEPPDFMSAGGHFNPFGKRHGAASTVESHAGDLPNIEIGADGTGTLLFFAPHLSLNPAASNGLAFGAGTAVVIHQAEDDHQTDPAGNSGARIACGVVNKPSVVRG